MTPTRSMGIVSVRFSNSQIELIDQEADQDGVARSQFIRDAAYARAVMRAAKRNATLVQVFDRLVACIEVMGQDELVAALRDLLVTEIAEAPPNNGHSG